MVLSDRGTRRVALAPADTVLFREARQMTFSATAWAGKPAGAITGTRPERTSSSATIPRIPPQWSPWVRE
ncbi:hypothetical protein [Methylobacterium platani]|uniref:Uncharacterized protein n=2 Tax=Methylobacterium platani TaxID=427683 RepID=A0A179S9L5_9HYPH|nr:hypothetical protein SQ03_05985 [Methylobacterium platani JCM 14648]OAS24085.1 hypothetical protein A5481_15065 [Methylobacterium platani]